MRLLRDVDMLPPLVDLTCKAGVFRESFRTRVNVSQARVKRFLRNSSAFRSTYRA